jgi:hypothetical protein
LLFFYQTGHNYAYHIDLYCAESWLGEPSECVILTLSSYHYAANRKFDRTEEMKPSWFDIPPVESDFQAMAEEQSRDEPGNNLEETKVTAIPFHKMWKDDMLWMPFLLSKQQFIGRVDLVDPAIDNNAAQAPLHPLVKWWFATLG